MEFLIALVFCYNPLTIIQWLLEKGEAAGLAIGSTILLNATFAGPISGASMNPARTLGPAIVSNHYQGVWVYMLGPILGAVAGAWAYNSIRFTDKPLTEILKSSSLIQKLDTQICPF
ncbi:hypothetical protein R6Q57_013639 [Mikania cordata]